MMMPRPPLPKRHCLAVANTGAAGWTEGLLPQARACFRENFVTSSGAANEAPPDQSGPSELVQLGPLPLGGSKTPSGQLLDRP